MEVRTEGVPAQDVRTKIVHRQTGKLLVMNRERNGTMGLKEKREATGADGEFWSVVPLETGPGEVPTKVRLDCHLKQDGNVPYDLIPSKQYPGSFRFFYQGKLFIGHGGGPTGVSTTFGDLSGPELDKDIWYFEYTAPPKVLATVDAYANEILVKVGALLESFLTSSEKKALRNIAHALDLAVDEFAALAKAAGRIEAAKLAALQAASDTLYAAVTNGSKGKDVGSFLGKFLRNLAEVIFQLLGAVGGIVGELLNKMADFVEKFVGGVATAAMSGPSAFVSFLGELNGMIFGISSYLTESVAAALLRLGINVAALAEAFRGLAAAFSSIKLDDHRSLGSLTVDTAIALLSVSLKSVFTSFGGLLKDVTVHVESNLSNPPTPGGPLDFGTAPRAGGQTKEYNFQLVARPFGLVVSKLGELLNHVRIKAENKRITDSADVLKAAVQNLIKLLTDVGVVPAATLTSLGSLSDALSTAATSGDSVGVGLTALKLLNMYGDVVEVVLGAAAGVVAGLGLALKNICYQLGCLVHQDLDSTGKSLKQLLQPMGLTPLMQSFDDALSRLNTAALAAPQDYDMIVLTVFTSFSLVINNVFRKVGNVSITVSNEVGRGSELQVLPPKEYNFELVSRPFGLVVSKLGELLNDVKRKAEEKRIRDSALVLDNAVDNLIKLLGGIGIVRTATLTEFGKLSDVLFTAVTSGDSVGVGITALKLLYMYGDVVETVLGAATGVVAGLGLGLKNICYQLGSLVHQDFAGAGKTLTGLLEPMGLVPIMQSFDDALSRLNTAALAIPQDFDMIVLTVSTSFSLVINNVFRKVGTASITPVSPSKEYNFVLVSRPFGLVVSKLGELLNHVRIKAENKRITDSADVLKAAVQNLIKLLTDVGVVPAATLTALGSLSDALSTAATSGDSVGVGLTALKLLNMYGDVVEVVLGAAAGVVAGLGLALKNICYQLGCLVHQDLDSAGKSLKQLLQPMGLTPLMQSFDDALSRLNTAALAAPQDYDMIVLTVFTSFSLVINNVFRKVGNVSITVSNEVGRGSELQVLPPKEYNFELVSRPFGLVVSKLGELLNDVKRKAEEKRIRDSALVLDNAVDNLIKLLGGIGIVRTATLTEFGKLSDVLFTAVTSGDSVGVGITALKLLYMYGDVVETVLGAATGVVAGLGLGLKNICYQLGSLVHQDFAGAGKTLTGLLEPMGLVPIMQSFDDALSRLNTAALAIPQDFDTIVLTVFTSFSLVINNVFRKVGTASITVPNGSGQGVSPSKIYNFELLSRPFGLVVSKLGELLNNVWRKADDKRIRDSAAVLDGAVDNLIKLLTDVGVVPAAMLTALGSLSDALFTAATSGNTVGVWVTAVELLNMYGDVVEVVFGAAAGVVDGLGLALKSICYQLGCLVQQDFESTAIALNTLLQPMGLGPIMQSLDDALSSLYTATLRLPQNYDMILLTAFSNFSVVIINVFRKVGNVSIIVPNEVGRGSEPQVLPPKEYNFELVSRPFGLVVSKLGELLNHVRIKAEKKRISDSALVLDNAVDNLIKLLAGIGIVPTAMLTEFGNLSDALSTAVTSGNSVGVGITALKLLNTYGNVVERVLGATPGVVDGLGLTLKSFCYELGSIVHQDFDGAGIALSGLLEPMGLGPIMQPFDEALSSLNRVALAFPQDYDMTVLTVFTSFSLVMNNVFRKVGTASIVNPGGVQGSGQPQVPVPTEQMFELLAAPFQLVLSELGKLLVNFLNKTGEKAIRTAAFALDGAIDALILLLEGFGVVAKATLTEFTNLSDVLYAAATAVNLAGLGKAILNVLNMAGDVLETVLLSAATILPGVGSALKNLFYQLGSLIPTLLDAVLPIIQGTGRGDLHAILTPSGILVSNIIITVTGSLAELLSPLGLNLRPFTDALSGLARCISTADIKSLGSCLAQVFGELSTVISGIFHGIQKLITKPPAPLPIEPSPPVVKPPAKIDFLANPIGEIMTATGQLLLQLLNKASSSAIRGAAFALDKAVDAFVLLLKGVTWVEVAKIRAIENLSDALIKVVTSANMTGLGACFRDLLSTIGNVCEVLIKGVADAAVALALAVKNLLVQLAILVQQLLDGILSIILGVGGILAGGFALTGAALFPILAPIAGLVQTLVTLVTGTLAELVKPLGLNVHPLSDALGRLAGALSRLDIKSLGPIFVDIFGSVSVIMVGIFSNIGGGPATKPPPTGPVTIKVDIKPAAAPFADVLIKVGELLHYMLRRSSRVETRKAAIALDAAVDSVIALLRGLGYISAANLDAAGNLSDALVRVAISTSLEGVGTAISNLLKKLAEITVELLGSAYENVGLAMKKVVDQVAGIVKDVVDGILTPIMTVDSILLALMVKPILFPIGAMVAGVNGFVTSSLEQQIRPFGLNAGQLSNALHSLSYGISTANAESIGPALRDVFKALAAIYLGVITGIAGVQTTVTGSTGMGSQNGAVNGSVGTGSQNGAVNGQTWPQPPPPHGATGSDFGTGQTWPPPPQGGTGSQFGTGPTWPPPPPPQGATGSDFGAGQTWPPPPPPQGATGSDFGTGQTWPPPPPPQGGTGSDFGTGPTWPQPPPPQGATGSDFGAGQTWPPPPPPPHGGTGSQFGTGPTWPQPPPPHGATGNQFGTGQTWPPTPPPHGATGNQFGTGQTWPAPPPPPGKGNPYEIPFGVKVPLGVPIDPYGNGGFQFQPGQPPSQSPHFGFGF